MVLVYEKLPFKKFSWTSNIHLNYINHPGDISMMRKDKVDEVKQLTDKMTDFYTSDLSQCLYSLNSSPSQIFPGKIVAAEIPITGNWGRAKIISEDHWKNEYFVSFLDFGYLMVLGRNNLATFVSYLFGKLPMQAFHSCLSDLGQDIPFAKTKLNYPLVSTLLASSEDIVAYKEADLFNQNFIEQDPRGRSIVTLMADTTSGPINFKDFYF